MTKELWTGHKNEGQTFNGRLEGKNHRKITPVYSHMDAVYGTKLTRSVCMKTHLLLPLSCIQLP